MHVLVLVSVSAYTKFIIRGFSYSKGMT